MKIEDNVQRYEADLVLDNLSNGKDPPVLRTRATVVLESDYYELLQAINDSYETKDAYMVLVNKDLTEGRGPMVVKAICELEVTAKRIAEGASTQGVNGQVERVTLHRLEIYKKSQLKRIWWYGPVSIQSPTQKDAEVHTTKLIEKAAEEKAEKALQKAKEAGLTEEDIKAIMAVMSKK